MSDHNESVDPAAEHDAGIRARVVHDLAAGSAEMFSKGGRVLEARVAIQSVPLLTDLMKVGLFSMNLDSASGPDRLARGGFPAERVSSFLLGVGMLYAIEVAPTVKSADGIESISVEELAQHVRRIENSFGEIPVDRGMLTEVASIARRNLMRAATPANAGQAPEAGS